MPSGGQDVEEIQPAAFAPSEPPFGGGLSSRFGIPAASAAVPNSNISFGSPPSLFQNFSTAVAHDAAPSQSEASGLSRAGSSADPPAKRSSSSRQPPMPSLSAVRDAQKLTQQVASGSSSPQPSAQPQVAARPTKQAASAAQPPMPSSAAIQAAQSKFAQTLGSTGASQPSPSSVLAGGARAVTTGAGGFNLGGAPASSRQDKPSGLFSFGPGPSPSASSAGFSLGGTPSSGAGFSGSFNFGAPPGATSTGASPAQPPVPSMSAVKAAQRLSESQQPKQVAPQGTGAAAAQSPGACFLTASSALHTLRMHLQCHFQYSFQLCCPHEQSS